MTNKQVLMGAACAAATFGGLQYAGFSGEASAVIPGTGFSINAEILKYILAAAAAFLPALADKLLPGLGNIVAKIIDAFNHLGTGTPVVAPKPSPAVPVEPPASCLCDDMDHLADIALRFDDPAAKANVVKIANDLFIEHTKGKPNETKPK